MSTPNNCVMLGCPPSSYTDRQAQNWQFRYAAGEWHDIDGTNGYYQFTIPAFSALFSGQVSVNGGAGSGPIVESTGTVSLNGLLEALTWSSDGSTYVNSGWGVVTLGEIFLAKNCFYADDVTSPGTTLGSLYLGPEFICKGKRYARLATPGTFCGFTLDPNDATNAGAVPVILYLDFSSLYVPADCGQDTGPNNFPTSPASDLTQGSPT